MIEQHNSTGRPQPCLIGHLRIVYYVKEFDHFTVDELGAAAELVQQEIDDSELGDPPYYCRRCRVNFEDWPAAKAHLEPVV